MFIRYKPCFGREGFSKIDKCENEVIVLGDNSLHEVHSRAKIPMQVSGDKVKNIQTVLYVPGLNANYQ